MPIPRPPFDVDAAERRLAPQMHPANTRERAEFITTRCKELQRQRPWIGYGGAHRLACEEARARFGAQRHLEAHEPGNPDAFDLPADMSRVCHAALGLMKDDEGLSMSAALRRVLDDIDAAETKPPPASTPAVEAHRRPGSALEEAIRLFRDSRQAPPAAADLDQLDVPLDESGNTLRGFDGRNPVERAISYQRFLDKQAGRAERDMSTLWVAGCETARRARLQAQRGQA